MRTKLFKNVIPLISENGACSMEHGGPICEFPVECSGQSFSLVGRLEVARGPSRSWPVLASPGQSGPAWYRSLHYPRGQIGLQPDYPRKEETSEIYSELKRSEVKWSEVEYSQSVGMSGAREKGPADYSFLMHSFITYIEYAVLWGFLPLVQYEGYCSYCHLSVITLQIMCFTLFC